MLRVEYSVKVKSGGCDTCAHFRLKMIPLEYGTKRSWTSLTYNHMPKVANAYFSF